ncbi:MAG: antitoxin VbhA family protein [Zoogloeaceae bacterium]|nr:antitoxin VbhA family protein [Zoogloeaceae bacterium]
MTFRVERKLRDHFGLAVERNHRPAAQVLRELMRSYVDETQVKHGLISIEEQRARQAAVDFARGSVALEGYKSTPEDEEHCRRYVVGEIDLAAFVKGPYGAANQER